MQLGFATIHSMKVDLLLEYTALPGSGSSLKDLFFCFNKDDKTYAGSLHELGPEGKGFSNLKEFILILNSFN